MRSLGWLLLPRKLHEQMQFDRHPINDFCRRKLFPLLASGTRMLDAGSGRIEEQHLRSELLALKVRLETMDMFPGEGVDHVGSIDAAPFPDNSFQVIMCTQVLEHVQSPDRVCHEIARILRPGGYAVVTAPQSSYLHNMPYHYFHFTKVGLAKLLNEAGLEVVEIEPQGGHFIFVAQQLHYTCRVLEQFQSRSKLKNLPFKLVILCCKFLFGFATKLLALQLDRKLHFEGNTQGWNVLCRKPNAKS